MKKVFFVLGLLLLYSLTLISPPTTYASVDASCAADPSSIGPFETTIITCSGFARDTHVSAYYVEPDGTAVACNAFPACGGFLRTNESGVVALAFTNGLKGFVTLQLGTYTFVVEQLGLGGAKVHQGTTTVTVYGGEEGVSGASLTTDASVYHPNEPIIVTGSGFAGFEVVTIWLNFPSPCSNYTSHFTDANNGATFENIPNFVSLGTLGVLSIKANASGSFTFVDAGGSADCKGVYSYVARGNTSGLGAAAEFTFEGNSVTTNASLVASKNSVNAFNDTITFLASGFGPNETLNCWTTSPEGRAVPYGIPGSFQPGPKMGPGGSGVISLTTGSLLFSPDDPFAVLGNQSLMSEGSLGVWALTCRGIASGTYAIANYTVMGGPLDP